MACAAATEGTDCIRHTLWHNPSLTRRSAAADNSEFRLAAKRTYFRPSRRWLYIKACGIGHTAVTTAEVEVEEAAAASREKAVGMEALEVAASAAAVV